MLDDSGPIWFKLGLLAPQPSPPAKETTAVDICKYLCYRTHHQLLFVALSLTIRLGMETGGETGSGPSKSAELPPEP